jgi:hypothetical protein
MYAWKFHRRDKFVIQSFTGGIREYMECLKKFRIGIRLTFRHSIYSRIPPVTDCITNIVQLDRICLKSAGRNIKEGI